MTGDDRLWWEDFTPGREWRFGHYDVTTEEIIDFARRYDPLDMHTDPALAGELRDHIVALVSLPAPADAAE